jgi:hypothetical protein
LRWESRGKSENLERKTEKYLVLKTMKNRGKPTKNGVKKSITNRFTKKPFPK